VPVDLIDDLVRAGCYRLLVPASHGGDEVNLPEALRVIEILAGADGAVGWTVGQAAVAQIILGYFPATAFDEVYAAGPDVIGAGAVAPKGKALRQDGGWRVSGQWPFITGCDRASWFYTQCVVLPHRGSQPAPNATPELRLMLFPASEVNILDTWRAAGLRGTASHDIVIAHKFCQDAHSCTIIGGSPSVRSAIFDIPPLAQAGLAIAAVAVGIAQGALAEVAQLAAGGRRPAFSTCRLAQSPVFQDRLGEAHMTLQAARALLYSQAQTAWANAVAGHSSTLLDAAGLRATASAVTAMATCVVDSAYELAGGAAVYDNSPLQRRLRDIHTATQHAINGRHFYGVVGALLAGEKADTMLF
jgi:alkylation response protein AidB-like acyl-CoA dehydrogenase